MTSRITRTLLGVARTLLGVTKSGLGPAKSTLGTAGRAPVIPGFLMKLAMLVVRLTPMPLLRFASRFSAKS